MLIFGCVPSPFSHNCASTGGTRPFDTAIIIVSYKNFYHEYVANATEK